MFTLDYSFKPWKGDKGYSPEFPGIKNFKGTVVHPQQWPEKLDYSGKRVVVIGSGATAITLVPAMPDSWVYNIGRARMGKNFDMKHFTPSYNPWDQRLCVVPDGDLFKVLKNGQLLEADIVITATGLDLQILGGLTAHVDGKPVNVGEVMSYKGVMMSSIPNFAMVFGYTNASWTLKADLAAEFVCRVINHMDKNGYARVEERKN